jgi:hypothetical protein
MPKAMERWDAAQADENRSAASHFRIIEVKRLRFRLEKGRSA